LEVDLAEDVFSPINLPIEVNNLFNVPTHVRRGLSFAIGCAGAQMKTLNDKIAWERVAAAFTSKHQRPEKRRILFS
jgi:hypothetical protein